MARHSVHVSDHALVRWMLRTGFLDLDPLRDEISKSIEKAAAAALSIGETNFLILADGLVYVVRDSTVVTVVPEDGRHRHVHALAARNDQGDA